MKQSHKLAASIVAALSFGIAVAAYAHPGQVGGGMGPQGGMQHGTKGSMEHGGMSSGGAGHGAGQQLMTPEERTALREKMRKAGTPEERHKIAEATRTEMRKRAQEKGITLREHRGRHAGATTGGPAASDQTHSH